jgi:multidrug efflux pump subunit AcrA (membrane-fusion protein)
MVRYLFIAALLLVSTGRSAVDPNRAANLVILDEASVKTLRLETVEAEERDFEETIFALGRIEIFPGKRFVVSPRVPGRTLTVNVEPDQHVEKGAEVAVIESRQPGDPPPSIRIIAPISGLVGTLSVTPGQPVTPDTALMEIVDLSDVHAIAHVPEYLVGKLAKGQNAHIRVPAYPDKVFEAELEHTGALAEAENATLEGVFHVNNPDMLLRPGMRAEFSIVTGKREGVMSIPREAVQGDAGKPFVYIADYELQNAYVKTPIEIGAQNDRFVEVTSGVLPGDNVVTRGAYSLAFAGKGSISLKEALDAAHGHPHAEDGSELSRDQVAAAQGKGGAAAGGNWRTGFTPLTTFFAASTALLLVLLALNLLFQKRTST